MRQLRPREGELLTHVIADAELDSQPAQSRSSVSWNIALYLNIQRIRHILYYFLSDVSRHFLEDIQSSLYKPRLDYIIFPTKQLYKYYPMICYRKYENFNKV